MARRDTKHFDCATRLHKAREMPRGQFKQEVERELTGRETEPWETIYFKLYEHQEMVGMSVPGYRLDHAQTPEATRVWGGHRLLVWFICVHRHEGPGIAEPDSNEDFLVVSSLNTRGITLTGFSAGYSATPAFRSRNRMTHDVD